MHKQLTTETMKSNPKFSKCKKEKKNCIYSHLALNYMIKRIIGFFLGEGGGGGGAPIFVG